ncbi:MAG: hypothetical protein HQ537_01895 [Parcubacteria group bacterium]|nr:hypothetical protein [Parcubacteria group bacterium]
MNWKKVIQIIILILLMSWYGFFLVNKVDLTIVDLGRHLKNGEVILQGDFDLLKTNFYSFTQPDYPVVNHHWGSGVIFFLIWQISGFIGLCVFYLLISLLIFYLFFRLAQKQAGFKISVLCSVLLIPLIAARTEIRPEIFSYFFIAVFFWVLWHWKKGLISNKWLFVLPVLEIIWVNTHIYFIFGPALIGLFLLDRLIKKRKVFNKIFSVLILTSLTTLISPFGLKGLIYPFTIFKDYGYRIVENQSVWFLENLGIISNPNLTLFKIVFAILVLSFILLLIKNRKKFSIIYLCLAVVFSTMAWLAIRNFTLFGFFALLIIAYNIKKGMGKRIKFNSLNVNFGLVFLCLAIFLITFFIYYQKLPLTNKEFGFGLVKDNNQSAEFFKERDIKGPIFNNYDIGSYLIYYLYPKEKVFTDNRPEAYSVAFFEQEYIPLQQDNNVWLEQDKLYNFNTIFFAYHDATPWAQKFLIERVVDDAWAPVFADDYAIIFLKRNDLNQSIIEKYEIPRNMFGIRR